MRKVWGSQILWLLFVIASTLLNARAEQLPIRTYTTADGLPHDSVYHIKLDSRGFLWVFTGDGLTRFDGYTFRNYTTDEGLADRRVNDLLETRAGGYWIATESGLCRFNPTGRRETKPNETISTTSGANGAQMFTTYNPHDGKVTAFNVLVEDALGAIWCGTNEGLYKVDVAPDGRADFHFVDLGNSSNIRVNQNVISILKDHSGTLWCGTTGGLLYRLFSYLGGINHSERIINQFDGARFQSVKPNLPSNILYPGWGWGQTIILDHTGEWWVPTGGDLYRFPKVERIEELARAHPQFMGTVGEDFNRREVFRLYEDSRGDVWMATTGLHYSLLRWERATGIVHGHTAETGVPPKTDFTFFREDRAGALWIGTSEGGGLLRYRDGKFKRFTVDRIVLTNMLGIGRRPFTIPSVGDTILVNLGEGFDDPIHYPGFGDPEKRGRQAPGQLFIHELVHTWQIDVTSFLPGLMCNAILNQSTTLGGDMGVYKYGPPGREFRRFNLEQQASIVDDWFGASGPQQSGQRPESKESPYFRYIRDNIRKRIL